MSPHAVVSGSRGYQVRATHAPEPWFWLFHGLVADVAMKSLPLIACNHFPHPGDEITAADCLQPLSPPRPLVVSVVTCGTSDDANGSTIEGSAVYLRVSKHGPAFMFHYSLDGTLAACNVSQRIRES